MGCADDGSPLMEACKRDSRETAGRGDPAGKNPIPRSRSGKYSLPYLQMTAGKLLCVLILFTEARLDSLLPDEISGRRNQRSPKSFSWETLQGFKTLITLNVEWAETV